MVPSFLTEPIWTLETVRVRFFELLGKIIQTLTETLTELNPVIPLRLRLHQGRMPGFFDVVPDQCHTMGEKPHLTEKKNIGKLELLMLVMFHPKILQKKGSRI